MKKGLFSYYLFQLNFILSIEIVFKGLASVLMNYNNYNNPAVCMYIYIYIYIYIDIYTHMQEIAGPSIVIHRLDSIL